MAGRDGDAGAAERRLAEALGAQASLAAAPTPSSGSSGSTGASRGPRLGSTGATRPARPNSTGGTRPPHPGQVGPRAEAPVGPNRRRREPAPSEPPAPPAPARSPAADGAVRLRRALLVALLAGVLLGSALAVLSVLAPGLLPALG